MTKQKRHPLSKAPTTLHAVLYVPGTEDYGSTCLLIPHALIGKALNRAKDSLEFFRKSPDTALSIEWVVPHDLRFENLLYGDDVDGLPSDDEIETCALLPILLDPVSIEEHFQNIRVQCIHVHSVANDPDDVEVQFSFMYKHCSESIYSVPVSLAELQKFVNDALLTPQGA